MFIFFLKYDKILNDKRGYYEEKRNAKENKKRKTRYASL